MVGSMVVALAVTGGALAYALLSTPGATQDRLRVVVTFYPLAYFAEQIGGDHVQVQSLLPYNEQDLHSVAFSFGNIAALQEADLFVYNGADLEPWVEADLLPAIDTSGLLVVEATANAGNLLIELEENGHGEDHEPGEVDPHTWIDPVLARVEAEAVLRALQDLDPGNASVYEGRAETLFARLEAIALAYESALSSPAHDAIIVAHDAFSYLGHRYGFEVIGVIGLSADEQPSTTHLASIVNALVQRGIFTLYVTPVYSDNYIQSLKATLEQETGEAVTVLPLYLLTGPVDGMDYLQQMEANLENLKVGLGV